MQEQESYISKLFRRLAACAAFAALVASCAAEPRGNRDAGAEVFSNACAACHGEDGSGSSADEAEASSADLRERVPQLSDGQIQRTIRDGKGEMEPLTLTDEEMDNVLAFLRSWDQ